ncbi:recombinase family protein [Clostridium niameyense]|uniref:recombinase family protein n=1 Tax=Clostridium niameyense TaxID=1622073 RepID=UPI00067EBEF7|nr:recombinase family protein [Clostridium niameyense]
MFSIKNVAMYIRLSNEDNDISKSNTKIESNSISNQRDLITYFIKNHEELKNYNIIEFCDDGYSGTNFERPSVKKLITKVKQREIECIVVKDFSRFGRNYLELGDYLEQVFPFLGVRFISINDGYDSARDSGITAGLDVGLKNLIYDLYSKDLSEKIKSAKLAKMKKGEYIGSFPSYGYIKDKNKKNSLLVDMEAAVIVKKIFKLAIEGKSTSEIAKILNSEEILPPAKRYQQLYQNKKWKNKDNLYWSTIAVLKILRDEIYLGKTINHKRQSNIVGSKNNVAVSKDEWITVSNTHESIISEKDFKEAQKVMNKYKKRKKRQPVEDRIIYSKIRCGGCKKCLLRSHTKEIYYKCRTNHYSDNNSCFKGRINESVIMDVLLVAIRNQALLANQEEKLAAKSLKIYEDEVLKAAQNLRKSQEYQERLNSIKIEEYEKYLDGKISKEEYLSKRDKISKDIEKVGAEISNLQVSYQSLIKRKDQNEFAEHFKGKHEISELNRELVDEFVEAIYIYGEKEIEIVWKFSDKLKGF